MTRFQELVLPLLCNLYGVFKNGSTRRKVRPIDPSQTSLDKSFENSQVALDDKLSSQQDLIEDDYLQKVNQYAIISLFSTIFPFAPVIALMNNTFEIHSDAYKYLFLYQRYPPMQAQDIGSWFGIMRFISFLSVSCNAAIVVFLSDSFQQVYLKGRVDQNYWLASKVSLTAARVLVFILYHVLVTVLCTTICHLVPNVPKLVQIGKRREVALDKVYVVNESDEGLCVE